MGAFLSELLTIPADSAGELRRLSLKQKIDQRILVVQTESAAVVAELDCEGERARLAGIYQPGPCQPGDPDRDIITVIGLL
jgi:hypothetical protein